MDRTERSTLLALAVPAAAAALTLAAVGAELAGADRPVPPPIGAYLLGLAAAAALLLRRRHGIAVAGAVLVISLGYHLLGYPGQGVALPLFVVCFSIAAEARTPWGAVVGAAIAAAWSAVPVLPPSASVWWDWPVLGPAVGIVAASVAGAIAGLLAREAAARHVAASAEERVRIAQEMHDVIAHTLTAVTVQTTVALDALDDDPGTARDALRRARALSLAAAPQLRSSLSAFRDGTSPEAPQPTLALLDEVLESAASAGLAVDARIDVLPGALPPVAELTIARIAQEAVTNTVRHARATSVRLTLQAVDQEVRLEVVDDGHQPAGAPGLGIGGMTERAVRAGGRLEVGPVRSGGFRVAAVLPLATGTA